MTWTVYELANDAERELYVAVTSAELIEEMRRNRSRPPRAIAHWPLEPRKTLTVLDVFADAEEASAAVHRRRVEAMAEGWRLLTQA